ncbi:MAG: 2-C-methyl-D-erythritol 4-phosphate cytidylyltransferase [Planctomycetaceae bacterium]|jgi:2-C-methyl-D-erythritol 4-phosphate cytidylyltransferase|nr:2-C-methyl-D-erythritol 4-phosphate cytidylyltransferase [Planctomycetaceae bacterium]MDP7278167.1 2-C-methyl-D-erythritol 4-phosphate cytidylyltransferase [Planctomycetaceae bacterium]
MASFAVILPAAGKSNRFSSGNKKPFVDLKGRAVWIRAAEAFVNRDDVVQTLVVVAEEDLEDFKERFRANLAFMEVEIVVGGASRMESVANALNRVSDEAEFIAVHDAARPLVAEGWINEVFAAAVEHGAAIPAIPVNSTLKRGQADGTVEATVSRDGLWAAQTPQVFRREWLVDAFQRRGDLEATDESQLVEQLGHPVRLVPGWPMNLKITTSADFEMAKTLLSAVPRDDPLARLHPFSEIDPRSVSNNGLDFGILDG